MLSDYGQSFIGGIIQQTHLLHVTQVTVCLKNEGGQEGAGVHRGDCVGNRELNENMTVENTEGAKT